MGKNIGHKAKTKRKSRLVIRIAILLVFIIFCVAAMSTTYFIKNGKEDVEETRVAEKNNGNEVVTISIDDNKLTNTVEDAPKSEINKRIFVGDSRYKAMSIYSQDEDIFIAENNMAHAYLLENLDLIKSLADEHTVIIIGLGVNDLGAGLHKYAPTINQLAEEVSAKVCYMLVNPVDEVKEEKVGYTTSNESIDYFNEQIKAELSSKVTVIDTSTYLKNTGFNTTDGLHYDSDTYLKIYNYILEAVDKL